MKKLTLCKGKETYELYINRKKIIAGKNYLKKYELLKIFRNTFNQQNSEYSENRDQIYQILVNDSKINPKKSYMIDLSTNFDLNTDLKMGSKSLTLKYMESTLSESDYNDSVNTINLLFQSLEEEINNLQNDIKITIGQLNNKNIVKLFSPFLVIGDEKACMYDLNYEEFILTLLRMVSKILENAVFEEVFLLLDIPILTSCINTYIQNLKKCYVLIFTNDYPSHICIEDFYICSKYSLDFADDEELYAIMCEEGHIAYELEEVKQMLSNYLNHVKDKYTGLIKELLE